MSTLTGSDEGHLLCDLRSRLNQIAEDRLPEAEKLRRQWWDDFYTSIRQIAEAHPAKKTKGKR